MKISIKELQEIFNKKVKTNLKVMGWDVASRTGWCRIESTKTECTFDYGFVDVNSKDLYQKYNLCIEIFNNLVHDVDTVVIEETYFSRNAKVFRMLSRLGGFIYAICHLKNIKDKYFITAIQARSALGFSTNVKKEVVHQQFHARFKKMKVVDPDVVDAIVLALNGVFMENKLDI